MRLRAPVKKILLNLIPCWKTRNSTSQLEVEAFSNTIPTKTGFMMSIGFFNDSWRNTGLMTCSTWENWVVQPLCKLTNQYERITAQSVFGGASAKKCCSCCSRNTHCPSQWLKQPLLVQTDVLSFIWLKVVLQSTVDWWSMLVGWAYLFGIVLWKEVCLGNVPRKGRNTNMNHDFTSFPRWWFDSTHLKNH